MQKEDEETCFSRLKEKVVLQLPQIIERVLGKVPDYHAKQVEDWNDSIGQAALELLQQASGNFKYIVNVSIMEKKGAGLHTSTAVFWDAETDGVVSYRWENKAMVCIVQAFGIGT